MAKLRASMSVEEFDDGYFSRGQEKGPDCRRCRGRRPAAGPDSAPGAGRGVGALIQRGGRAVAGMLTIATAGGS